MILIRLSFFARPIPYKQWQAVEVNRNGPTGSDWCPRGHHGTWRKRVVQTWTSCVGAHSRNCIHYTGIKEKGQFVFFNLYLIYQDSNYIWYRYSPLCDFKISNVDLYSPGCPFSILFLVGQNAVTLYIYLPGLSATTVWILSWEDVLPGLWESLVC